MNLIELNRYLRQLGLGGIAAVLETRLQQAQTEPMAPIDVLSCLVSDESPDSPGRASPAGREIALVSGAVPAVGRRDESVHCVERYSSDGNLNEHHRILQNRAAGNGLGRTAQGRIVQRREPETHPRCTRYSVAVWRASDSQTGETTYWVGFHLYWSAVMEFYDAHFTDDIYYRNEWKKSIAPECRGN